MPKMSRPIQILLPPWLDDWISFIADRYGISKAKVMRNYITTGIIFWSTCTKSEAQCPMVKKLTDECPELNQQIYDGTISSEDYDLLTDDLAFEARLALSERRKLMK